MEDKDFFGLYLLLDECRNEIELVKLSGARMSSI